MKNVTWPEISKLVDRLYYSISKSDNKFTKVIGIERGGLYISQPIAQKLNIPHYSIKVSFYGDDSKRSDVPVVDFKSIAISPEDKILLIDDLVDSGATLKYLKENCGFNFKSAGLYWNPKGEHGVKPDFYVVQKINVWVHLPWED